MIVSRLLKMGTFFCSLAAKSCREQGPDCTNSSGITKKSLWQNRWEAWDGGERTGLALIYLGVSTEPPIRVEILGLAVES